MNLLAAALESNIGDALKALPVGSPAFWGGGLNALLNNLTQTFLVVAVALATLVLIFGGIKWVTGGGDKEALGTAQKMITSALIGLVIIFSTWAILGLVKNFFGISGSGGTGAGTGTGAGSGTLPSLAECQNTICREAGHVCPAGYNTGTCYKSCRCICNAAGGKWAYDNPWCDADTHQYACQGSARASDKHGAVSKSDLKCAGD